VTQSAAERYLRLGLQLGRHVEGIVDAYYGPPELAAAVDAAPPVDPPALVSAAEALLDELEDGWLRDQATVAQRSPRSCTTWASSSISLTLSPSSGRSSRAGGRRSTRR
jgi:hypothetical protein